MSELTLNPVYLTARAAIVAPERALPVTLYSIQNWVPRLGAERWSLIMLLRAMCVDAPRRSNGTKHVICSWQDLADVLNVHPETLASWFKHEPIPGDKPWRKITPVDTQAEYLANFVPRLRYAYETRKGRARRVGFLLEVLMEDPIIPEHEAELQRQAELLMMRQSELQLDDTAPKSPKKAIVNPDSSDSQQLVNPDSSDLQQLVNPDSSDLQQVVNPDSSDLQQSPQTVNPDSSDLQQFVNPVFSDSQQFVNPDSSDLQQFVNPDSSDLQQFVNPDSSDLQQSPQTVNPVFSDSQQFVNPDSSDSQQVVNPDSSDLQQSPQTVNPVFSDLQPVVNPDSSDSQQVVNPVFSDSELVNRKSSDSQSENSEAVNVNVNVNRLKLYIQQLTVNVNHQNATAVVELTEELLDDTHSTAMLYKVLKALTPAFLHLYVIAVETALASARDEPQVNRGAVFVRTLRDLADEAGVDLGFKRSRKRKSQPGESGIPPPPTPPPADIPLQAVETAVWQQTKSVLRRQMTRATFESVMQDTSLYQQGEAHFVLGVQSPNTKEWFENRLAAIVQRTLSNVVGQVVTVSFRLLE